MTKIVVTATDIYNSRRLIKSNTVEYKSCCPIAMSLKRRGYVDVDVNYREITFRQNGKKIYKYLPTEATDWIMKFDNYNNNKPFQFHIPK